MPARVVVQYAEFLEQPGAEPKPAGAAPPQVLVREVGAGKPRESLINPGQEVSLELGAGPGQVTIGLADQGKEPVPEPPKPVHLPERPLEDDDDDDDDDDGKKGKSKPKGKR